MNKYIIKSSVISIIANNSTQVYISTSEHTIINAIVSAKATDNALNLSIIKNPIFAMFVHVVMEDDRRPSPQ